MLLDSAKCFYLLQCFCKIRSHSFPMNDVCSAEHSLLSPTSREPWALPRISPASEWPWTAKGLLRQHTYIEMAKRLFCHRNYSY